MYHYLIQDFYDPVWPNLAASAVCTAILWLKMHAVHKQVRAAGTPPQSSAQE
jgi:hypothetical protein